MDLTRTFLSDLCITPWEHTHWVSTFPDKAMLFWTMQGSFSNGCTPRVKIQKPSDNSHGTPKKVSQKESAQDTNEGSLSSV